MSIDAVEAVFTAHPAAHRMTRACIDFLGDAEAERVLKKGFHQVIEERMRFLALRADPPSAYGFAADGIIPPGDHPLDDTARAALGDDDQLAAFAPVRYGLPMRGTHLFQIVIRSILFVSEAVEIYFRFGVRNPKRQSFRVGTPHAINQNNWGAMRKALEDLDMWTDDALVTVLDRPDLTPPPPGAPPCIDLEAAPVDRRRWWTEVMRPGLRLLRAALWNAFRHPGDPVSVQLSLEAIKFTRASLPIWRLAHNLQLGSYIDAEEYTVRQGLKSIILGKQGTQLVRWPHSQMDDQGVALSYMSYHLFLSGGPYVSRISSATRAPRCKDGFVGLYRNDSHMIANQSVDKTYDHAVTTHRNTGGKVLAYFGAGPDPHVAPIYRASLYAALRQVAMRDDWMMVIKTKGHRPYGMYSGFVADSPLFAELQKAGKVVLVDYFRPFFEPCPAGWLIDVMDVGIGTGSIQIEALTQGKPTLSYMPVGDDSELNNTLRDHALWHETVDGFEAALADFLDNPTQTNIPYDWFREQFDPFGDDQALSRIARLLWAPAA
ncbi:MAG: hypothetical protein HQ494_01720 [Rhodospirillales bacterium]|nr:hypothetical protein [Rhodospirillales bacterium]